MSRILLVEDEELNRALVRAILARVTDDLVRAAELVEADTLASARATLAGTPVDVILLDVNLPDGSGLTLATELTAWERRPRVIALTASVLPHERRAALAAGCDAFLNKPFAAADLVAELAVQLAHPTLR
jgi:two-component system KDP operon response regulator KdpE